MSIINTYFDKIYYINLEKRNKRNDECLFELNKHGIIAERFNAIDSSELNISGQLGCLMSHLELIKKAKANNYNTILILEDDVIFSNNINDIFIDYINNVPGDWDMLYFGGNHNTHCGANITNINEKVIKCYMTYTAHSYAINSNMYDILIDYISKDITRPIDVIYTDIQKMYNVYSFYPGLTYQRPNYSDIQNDYVDYTKIIR